MTTIDLHRTTIQNVLKSDYYLSVFGDVCSRYPEIQTTESLDDVCAFWNSFWFQLPDTPAIRRFPFFDICDLAEGSYLDNCEE